MSGRCVSCNEVLKETELFWIEERKTHNDMCGSCRTKSRQLNFNRPVKNSNVSEITELELWEAYLEQRNNQNIEE